MVLKGCVSSEMIATGKGVACQCCQLSFMPTTSFGSDAGSWFSNQQLPSVMPVIALITIPSLQFCFLYFPLWTQRICAYILN